MAFDQAVSDFGGAVSELAIDPVALQDVQTALRQILTMMDGSDFGIMATIQRESFGGNNAAMTLAYHHGLAHEVMYDTIQGIKKDVHAFLQNVNKSAEVVQGVDADAAADLKKKHDVLLNALDKLDTHNGGDSAYNHARNHFHDPWVNSHATAPPPGPGQTGAGGSRVR